MLPNIFSTEKNSAPVSQTRISVWQVVAYRLFYKFYKLRAEKRGAQNGYVPEPEVATALSEKSQMLKKQYDWNIPLKGNRFVIFDTETTGFYPYHGDEIIAIGGVVLEDGQIKEDESFNRLVNPFREIPPAVTEITGITNEMVSDQPGVCTVINDFLDFIGDGTLVAHNAEFDMAFLNIKLNWYTQTQIQNPVIDTFKLSRALSPEHPSHDLDSLLKRHQVPPRGRHTALGDSLMTAEVFRDFLGELEEKQILTLKQLFYYLHVKNNFAFTP